MDYKAKEGFKAKKTLSQLNIGRIQAQTFSV